MATFVERYGPWALITGASSGLGAEYARQLAAEKMNVVLVARRADKMEALAKELYERHKIEARVASVDLSKPDFLEQLEPTVAGLEIGLLINNAGFSMTGPVVELDAAKQASMVELACRAPVLLTHRFAPAMVQRKRGGIVFTASTMAFGGAAGWATYNATKSFDLVFAEGLGAELGRHGVHVQALCPGGTRTEFADVAGTQISGALSFFMMDAAPVVRASMFWLGWARVVVPGLMNKLQVLQMKCLPRRVVSWILGHIVRLIGH